MSDLISRLAATTLPVLPKEYREYQTFNLDDAYEKGWMDCQKYIANLPSAEPKQGEWVSHMVTQSGDYAGWHCSCCGTKLLSYWTCKYKYCPECGARMVQE